MRTRRRVLRWVVFLVLAGAGGAWAWQSGAYRQVLAWTAGGGGGGSELRYHVARRAALTIGLTEGGSLRAVKNYNVASQLKATSKISWVIPEGAQVKKGDRVVEFETKPTLDQIKSREADLEQAQRQLVVVEENLRIETSNGKSLVAAARTKLDDTKEALKRFTQLDAPKRFKDMEDRALAARKSYEDAAKALSAARTSLDEGMLQDDTQRAGLEKQVQLSQDSLRNAQKTLSNLGVEQKLYKGYDYPRDLEARRQAVTNAELDLAKAEVAAKSQVLQKEAELGRVKDQIQRITRDLTELRGEVGKSVLAAPVDGMVLYGDAGGGGGGMYVYYGGRGPAETKVGADVYTGQVVLTIPDLSAFEIDISVGEEYRGKLRKGCRAIVTVEAVPGLVIEGKLQTISSLAQARNMYDPGSPKAFRGVIQLSNSDPRMVSGMSARVEIIAEVLEDTLLLPVEAVFNEGGKPFCCVLGSSGHEKRFLRTGASNDNYVQVLSGLEEGQKVCLFLPSELASGGKGPPEGPASAPASRAASRPASGLAAGTPEIVLPGPTSRPAGRSASRPAGVPPGVTTRPATAPASAPAQPSAPPQPVVLPVWGGG